MIRMAVVTLVFLVGLCQKAAANESNSSVNLIAGCKEVVAVMDADEKALSFGAGYCLGLATGMLDSLHLSDGSIGEVKVCVPNDRDVLAVIRKIVAIAVEHPDIAQRTKPGAIVALAIIQKYPCASD